MSRPIAVRYRARIELFKIQDRLSLPGRRVVGRLFVAGEPPSIIAVAPIRPLNVGLMKATYTGLVCVGCG